MLHIGPQLSVMPFPDNLVDQQIGLNLLMETKLEQIMKYITNKEWQR